MIPYTDTLIYQCIYGTQVSKDFLAKTEGLQDLIKDTQDRAKSNELYGLKNYKLHTRSAHSAFNLLLQSAGAIYMKQYLVDIDVELRKHYTHGVDFGYVANIHDAVNIECKPELTDHICEILVKGFETASIKLGLKYYVKGQPSAGQNQYETH